MRSTFFAAGFRSLSYKDVRRNIREYGPTFGMGTDLFVGGDCNAINSCHSNLGM
jgi:hypothetical protein